MIFIVVLCRNFAWQHNLVTPLRTEKKKRHTMNSETRNGSDIDLENIIAVTLDDLPKDDRNELERELEEEKIERLKLKLAGYQKKRNVVVKK